MRLTARRCSSALNPPSGTLKERSGRVGGPTATVTVLASEPF